MDIRTTTIARLLAATFFAALAIHFYSLLRPYPLIGIPITLALAGAAINVGLRGRSGPFLLRFRRYSDRRTPLAHCFFGF